jgi:CRP/FNR family transcriptional regulator, cyclic AMP receptor protein
MRSPNLRPSSAAGGSAQSRSHTSGSTLAVALLGKTALFGPLERDDRVTVAGQMRKASFEPGQTIFGRGDAGGDVYLVVRGRVRLSVFSLDGRLLSFKHADAGDIFGEIAALDGGPRTADAIALTRVEAMTLAQEQLLRLVEANPRVARAAIACLCQRLRDTSEQVEAIALHPVEVRLARFLLSRLKLREGGPLPESAAALELGMSQSELASLIGASRQKVNAALALLEGAGAIERTRGRVTCKIAKLVEVAVPE